MAKQDEYVRITLRLPPDLHKEITEVAGAASLNAEIVRMLQESISYRKDISGAFKIIKTGVDEGSGEKFTEFQLPRPEDVKVIIEKHVRNAVSEAVSEFITKTIPNKNT